MPETRSSASQQRRTDATEGSIRSPADSASAPLSPDAVELLGDEHTRRILHAVFESPGTGRELSARLGLSRATVYRHLDRLMEHGLVESDLRYDPDGHHRRRYRATLSCLRFDLADGSVTTDRADVDDVSN